METQTGPPRIKKRRPVHVAAIHSPLLAKASAGDDGSSSQKQPSSPGPDGGDVDGIGSLPDGVLGDIISLLLTTDGARTQILGSRWRPLWRSAPLNLDSRDLPDDIDALCGAVAGIFAAHPGPFRYVRIPSCCLWHKPDAVDTWLLSRALDNLEELHLSRCHHGWEHWPYVLDLYRPLQSTFRFCPSLRVLTLSTCSLPDSIAQTLRFPELQKLALELVVISEGSLNSVIAAGCPKLECSTIFHSMGFSSIHISSASLRNVSVSCHTRTEMIPLWEIIVKDAPCLEKLLFRDHPRHAGLGVSVIAAPKLETLGCLNDRNGAQRIEIGSIVIQGLRVIDSKTRVCTIKTIGISFHSLKLDTMIDLMRCFPFLENLYLKIGSSNDHNLWRCKYRDLLGSLDIPLKKIVLLRYKGAGSYVNFATFFIMNAKRLEIVKFVGDANMEDEEFIANQHKLLQLEKRASIGAQFYFKTVRCNYNRAHINNPVHDLCIADPFECTCFSVSPLLGSFFSICVRDQD